MSTDAAAPQIISQTTVLSLGLVVVLLTAAYSLSLVVLPRRISTKERGIYIWHIFNSLTHFVLEGSFLYYSLTAFVAVPSTSTLTLYGAKHLSYGTKYSSAPLARLWQEYARADIRWGESDVVVVCIEAITVLLCGPLAFWISELVRRGDASRWFWMSVLATAEIYGGYMTFVPEWLTGSEKLVTEVWMYKCVQLPVPRGIGDADFSGRWLYLFFFNGLWVVIPGWLLWESYGTMVSAVEKEQKLAKKVE